MKLKLKAVVIFWTCLLAGSILLPIFANGQAQAATTVPTEAEINAAVLMFVNAATINAFVGKATYTFFDKDPTDTDFKYAIQGYQCNGTNEITLPDGFTPQSNGTIIAKFNMDYPPTPTATQCSSTKPDDKIDKVVTNPGNATMLFVYSDATHIISVFGDPDWTFTQSSNANIFKRDKEAGQDCTDVIVISSPAVGTNPGAGTMFELDKDNHNMGPAPAETGDPNCHVQGVNFKRTVAGPGGTTLDQSGPNGSVNVSKYRMLIGAAGSAAAQAAAATATTIAKNQTARATCENSSGSVLGWMVCGVIKIIDGAVGFLDNQIQSLLTVGDGPYKDGGRVQEIWGRMRNIAFLILIPIMLIMVIGTALGFDFISAYTVKRAMPRLVAAVLFIVLSWSITTFLIQISNVLGTGVLGLMGAGTGTETSLAGIVSPTAAGVFEAMLIPGAIAAVAAVAVGAVTMGIVFSYALVTVVALFIGFLILSLRQVILLLMVITAPVAILVWIFPGNDKFWKIWRETFFGLLLMFPLITLLIGAGRLFASVVHDAGFDGALGLFMEITAYIAPYFLIPATFKLAGGLMGNLAGVVNNKGKGFFDKRKQKRAQTRAEGMQRFKTGDGKGRFRGSRGVRRAGLGLSAGWKGRFGYGKQGEQAIATLEGVNKANRLKENAALAQLAFRDDANAVLGLSEGSDEVAVKKAQQLFRKKDGTYDEERGERALAGARAIGITRANATAALSTMSQNKSRAVGYGQYHLVQEAIEGLAGGNKQLAQDLAYEYQYNSRNAGRLDLGGDWTGSDVVEASSEARDAVLASGGTVADAEIAGQKAARRAVFYDGVKRAEVRPFEGGHSASTKQAAQIISDDMTSEDIDKRLDAGVLLKELHGNLAGGATGENRDVIIKTLKDNGIDLAGNIDQQILNKINGAIAASPGATAGPISAAELNARARTWSGNVPQGLRAPGEPPGPTPAGGAPS